MPTCALATRWGRVLATAVLLISATVQSASAQSAGYTKLTVKGRVQLEIPDTWSISDAEQRKRVKDLAEKMTGLPSGHMAALSAQSFPAPSRVFVRVSFLELAPPITKAEVLKEVQADRGQVVRDLASTWNQEAPTMWAGLAKSGIKQVGQPTFAVERIGGQTALVIHYGRTSTVNAAETMRVTQFHVPLGSEKALITLSYIAGDQAAAAAAERVKSSISIR